MKTSSLQLQPDSCEKHERKTYRITVASRQRQTSPDPTVGATAVSFMCLATRAAIIRTQFFSVSYERRSRPLKRGGRGLLHENVIFMNTEYKIYTE